MIAATFTFTLRTNAMHPLRSLLPALLLLPFSAFAQDHGAAGKGHVGPANSLVHWVTLAEAEKAAKADGKPLMVDLQTAWCGWCRRMESGTFNDPQTAAYINSQFHPVSFDAEGRDTVMFYGQRFTNPQYEQGNGRHGTHEFTLAVGQVNGRIGYPTIVYFDSEGKVIAPVASYFSPQDLEPILVYIAEGAYKTQDYKTFRDGFKSRRTAP